MDQMAKDQVAQAEAKHAAEVEKNTTFGASHGFERVSGGFEEASPHDEDGEREPLAPPCPRCVSAVVVCFFCFLCCSVFPLVLCGVNVCSG